MYKIDWKVVSGILAFLLLCAVWGASLRNDAEAQVGPPNQIQCNQGIINAANPTSLTQIVPAVSGKVIVLCGWHATTTVTATASTFELEYGTGTNCGTGTTPITPAISVSSTAPSADHVDFAQLGTPMGQALCLIVAGTTPNVELLVYIGQY